MEHKAGFINIIGNPNVGKSTLMNALIGENLCVVTAKAQTTRHRVLGIINGDDYQAVFSDTPGILEPRYLLQESMMKEVHNALEDADIFLLVIDALESFDHQEIIDKINQSGLPVVVAINKIDLSNQPEVDAMIRHWQVLIPGAEVIPVSALHRFNVDLLLQRLLEKLPVSPPYYDKEELTDRSERFFISEIIRGKILELYRKEVPYCSEVVVESFREEEGMLHMLAVVYVTRESQKVILIGEQGKAIKKLGTAARREIEKFLDRHIYLELLVKVSRDWREDKLKLKKFGYPL